ncbi:MAG TPA: hypothetical protein PLZ93_03850 [Nocardioides sp.]|uniref:hypothetical protein n=1 Tax=uncultured Nocardioides sp. TaxID=198441 RepID=UPI000EEAE2A4|nr:hypothetical protein [uncultured Nocardioides sp.]HCB04402.1 hypothetical protein [Nocardioides sp.]HRI94725.1 hypothetical protein [Nocardioides sp.]
MRALLVAAAACVCLAAGLTASSPAVAAVDGGGLPIEDYAGYQPQRTCTQKPKPGTVALGVWLVATYGGGGGAVNRPCTGSSTSEHKDGRAVDWTLDAADPADRTLARAFLSAAFATDAAGNENALARRMGIMYVIWNDHYYPAYHQFEKERYLSSGCRSKKRCSKTLRHRDHMHISLSKAGGRGLTSFYVDLVTPQLAS